jgi:hypothetical protein
MGGQDSPCIRVAIFQQQIIPQNAEQDRTDGSSVRIPPVSRKRKTSVHSEPFLGREKPLEIRSKPFLRRETSEFHSKPFPGREKIPQNSILNHFSEEKNLWNSIPNYFWMRKTLEFRSEPFLEEKKPQNYGLNHFLKRKNFGILFRIIFGREKNFRKRQLLLAAL